MGRSRGPARWDLACPQRPACPAGTQLCPLSSPSPGRTPGRRLPGPLSGGSIPVPPECPPDQAASRWRWPGVRWGPQPCLQRCLTGRCRPAGPASSSIHRGALRVPLLPWRCAFVWGAAPQGMKTSPVCDLCRALRAPPGPSGLGSGAHGPWVVLGLGGLMWRKELVGGPGDTAAGAWPHWPLDTCQQHFCAPLGRGQGCRRSASGRCSRSSRDLSAQQGW